MAIKIIVPLIIIAVCVSLLIKKILMKFNAKLEKFNNENKRVDLYVNTDSFFENKYILSVLQNNSNN